MNAAGLPTTATTFIPTLPYLGANVPYNQSGEPGTMATNVGTSGTGAGQDFVLFDDAGLAGPAQLRQLAFSTSGNPTSAPLSIVTNPNMGLPTGSLQNPAAFTQYRNVPQQSNRGMVSANGNESPFSSPASKVEDEFSPILPDLGGAGPSQIPPSGTLSKGTPKSKRARGHGYSSSWNGGNLQQHLHQLQQNSSPPFPTAQQQQMGGVGMAANSSFGGFPGAGSGSDWSGSDTSPRNPPSGNFGPPIHSLSLADGSPDLGLSSEHLASLFPATVGQFSNATAASSAGLGADAAAIAALVGSAAGSLNAHLSSQQQEDRARQQIRADLMGVDSRALKGQLRDIQQGGAPTSLPMYDGSGPQTSNVLFPFIPNITPFGAPNDGVPPALTGQPQSGNAQPSSKLPAQPSRQFSARTQQAIDRARAQVPTRKRMVRENSEQTVSPQEAFLDYEDIDAMLQASQNPSRSLASGPSLFASMPSTTHASIDKVKVQQQQQQIDRANAPGTSTPRAMADVPLFPPAHEGTPSLVDGGSSTSSNSRATSSVPSPPQRAPLNRGETVRPLRPKQERDSASQQSSQSSTFSRSDLGLLSPTESTTSSTEDDEDEKPYVGTQIGHGGVRPSFGQAAQQGGYGPGNFGWGPRFSVVSSSSSESEDDLSPQQRGHANALSSSQQSLGRRGSGVAMPPSQQQAMLGNAGNTGPANIAALLSSAGRSQGGNLVAGLAQQFALPLDTSAAQMMPIPAQQSSGDAPSESGSQSQDEGIRKSPAIRSSAQAIFPFAPGPPSFSHPVMSVPPQQMPAMTNPAAFANPVAMALHHAQAQQAMQARVGQRDAKPDSRTTGYGEQDGGEEEESEDWNSDEEEDEDSTSPYPRSNNRSRTSTRGRARKSRGATTATSRRRSQSAGGGAAANSSGNGLTVCDYVSPLTGDECGTEFHRPYDLARHRETIHAREEATLLRQGKITKEQCAVLYKEVDPARSLATVEWRCDGPDGCGALFSRKDALLRHRRIRNH